MYKTLARRNYKLIITLFISLFVISCTESDTIGAGVGSAGGAFIVASGWDVPWWLSSLLP